MVSGLKPLSKSSNRQSINNDNTTIDAKHSEMINYFKNLQESLPNLKEELKKLIFEYNNKDSSRKNEIEYILYRDNLREKINELKSKINSINNNEELNKYYLNVGVLLHSYYENIENSKNINNSENFEENLINYDYDLNKNSDDEDEINQNEEIENEEIENEEIDIVDIDNEIDENSNKEIKKSNYKNVLNFFNDRETKETENYDKNNINNDDTSIIENNKNDGVYTSLKISDFVKEESTFKKKNILDEYLQKIDSKYISKIKVDSNICKCPNCKNEMIIYPSDGIQICENCGIQQNILIESDKPSFKDPPMEVCYFSYKRINHFNEFAYKRHFYYQRIPEIFNLLKIIKKMIFNNLYIFYILILFLN
jgi:ribosomal protein S27E